MPDGAVKWVNVTAMPQPGQVVLAVLAHGQGGTWLPVDAAPLWHHGAVHEVYASFADITEQVLLSQELNLQTSTDDLTGFANRRSLMQRQALEFRRRAAGGRRSALPGQGVRGQPGVRGARAALTPASDVSVARTEGRFSWLATRRILAAASMVVRSRWPAA